LFFRDLTPLEVATTSAFTLASSRSEANELVLSYRAKRKIQFGYRDFQAGDTIQFIVPTPDAIQLAVTSAKRMMGYCAGVVFFRWPASNDTLTMQPDEALMAAGMMPTQPKKFAEIRTISGGCVSVNCVDLYLVNRNPFAPDPTRYRIRSSTEVKYFLPDEKMPVRMIAPSNLELSLPAYCGRGNMYLGRAVTDTRAEFTVEKL
jgi:hypothetical protein